ncbi:MAG TPA: hypothetical protein VI423_04190 [Paenisporosarcina sp.]|nr:hypothetical protein [Paenisporosarcina sp.]
MKSICPSNCHSKQRDSLGITDFGGKGQNPEARFIAIDEKENNLILSTTTAHRDYPDSDPEKITLDNGY